MFAIISIVGLHVALMYLHSYQHTPGFEAILPDTTCTPPCVLGVQPGVTTAAEALRLLSAHPMVDTLRHDQHGDGAGEIWWNWQPKYDDLKPVGINVMWHETDGIISGASIPTTVPLYEYRVKLGTPRQTQLTRYPSSGDVVVREVYGDMYLSYSYRCVPTSRPQLHKQPITILVNPEDVRFRFDGELQNRHVFHANPCRPQ